MGPKVPSRYSRAQMLRFPVLFGGILGMFLIGFRLRKSYFADEIDSVRRKNFEESLEMMQVLEKTKETANEEIAKRKANKT